MIRPATHPVEATLAVAQQRLGGGVSRLELPWTRATRGPCVAVAVLLVATLAAPAGAVALPAGPSAPPAATGSSVDPVPATTPGVGVPTPVANRDGDGGRILIASHGAEVPVSPFVAVGPGARTDGADVGTPGGSLSVAGVNRSVDSPAVDQRQRFTVTVENDGTAPVKVTSVAILPKENAEYRGPFVEQSDFRVLDPGETLTVVLYHRFDSAGMETLDVRAEGVERTPGADHNATVEARRTFTMEVVEPREPALEIEPGDLRTRVDNRLVVTVTNDGRTPIENVELRVGGDVTVVDVPTRSAGRIAPGESETFAFTVTADEAGAMTLDVGMRYDDAGGHSRTLQRRVRVEFEKPELADVRVSGVEFERDGDTVVVTGEVGNVGRVGARGVTLGVEETDGVGPAASRRSDIVGSLEPDEVDGFELHATVEDGADTVVLTVEYSSNGVERTVEREVGPIPAPTEETSDQESTGVPVALFGGLIVLALLGFVRLAWYAVGGEDGTHPESAGSTDATASNPPTGSGGGQPGAGSTTSGRADPGGGEGRDGPRGSPSNRGDPGGARRPDAPPGASGDRDRGQTAGAPDRPDRDEPPGAPDRPDRDEPAGTTGDSDRGEPAGGPDDKDRSDSAGSPGPAAGHGDGPGRRQRTRLEADAHGSGPGGSTRESVGSDGATEAGSDPGVRCDGCGEAHAPDRLGSVAVGRGETARVCQECQKDALTEAKRRLGARADRDLDGNGRAGEQSARTCDGCGETVPGSDLEAMTLPDGSAAVACVDCRESALAAARRELTGEN